MGRRPLFDRLDQARLGLQASGVVAGVRVEAIRAVAVCEPGSRGRGPFSLLAGAPSRRRRPRRLHMAAELRAGTKQLQAQPVFLRQQLHAARLSLLSAVQSVLRLHDAVELLRTAVSIVKTARL